MNDFEITNELYAALFCFTLITSVFTAVLGQGGGLMLMGVLAQFIPPTALIPVHAVIQAASNSSRAALSLKNINWSIITPILVGVIIGGALVSPFIAHINWDWMQLIIGLYILWSVWGKELKLKKNIQMSLGSLGFVQGSLGVLLGATGPLGNAILLAKGLNREQIIASNAVIMFSSHITKLIIFLMIGVVLSPYVYLLGLLSLAAILGSFIGSLLRPKIPEALFFRIFKITLSLLAFRMLYLGFIEL